MSKIAFLFPGQGAQAVGMGSELDRELPAAKALFDRAGEVLGIDLRRLCFEGPAQALEATDVSQPAIYVASLAALESLKAAQPEVVDACAGAAGLSLGEYTALTFAGALGVAAVGLMGHSLRGSIARRAREAAHVASTPLRAVHSGHIGDYVAWLVAGVAVLGASFALALQ
jgi:[acyl-carrier-protein] S-malonyltransferase